MKNSATPDVSPEAQHHPRTLTVVWRWLTKTAATLSQPERRRSNVLTVLLLTLIFSAGLFLVSLSSLSIDMDLRGIYAILIGVLLCIFAVAFGLNRAGHYSVAAGLLVTCLVLGPWISILLNFETVGSDIVRLLYILISVLVCSLLLSTRVTIVLAALQNAALWLVSFISPVLTGSQSSSLLGFFGFTSTLIVISNFITRRDLDQIDRQTGHLIENETLLRELSVRDPLTGLFNRRYMEEILALEIIRAMRKEYPIGIIMVDIDHFKRINDIHGHAAGDAVLVQAANFLRNCVRASDAACRYGGEEFVFVLPEASQKITQMRAEHMREEMRNLHISFQDQILEAVTLSIGVAVFPANGSTGDAILKAADAALYQAKDAGRDRVILAV